MMEDKKMLSLTLPRVVSDELKRQADSYDLTITAYIRALVAYAKVHPMQFDQLTQSLTPLP